MAEEPVDTFQASVARCLESPGFVEDFYDRFVGSSEEIRTKFVGTDFARQHRALAESLQVMAVAVQGGPGNIARQEMKRLARVHQKMAITPAMYDVWLECMLKAAGRHDPLYSPAVGRAWSETLRPAIEYMRSGVPFAN